MSQEGKSKKKESFDLKGTPKSHKSTEVNLKKETFVKKKKKKVSPNEIVVTKDGFSFRDIDKLDVEERIAAFNKWISSKQGQRNFNRYFSECKRKTDILKNISNISPDSLNDIINI